MRKIDWLKELSDPGEISWATLMVYVGIHIIFFVGSICNWVWVVIETIIEEAI